MSVKTTVVHIESGNTFLAALGLNLSLWQRKNYASWLGILGTCMWPCDLFVYCRLWWHCT